MEAKKMELQIPYIAELDNISDTEEQERLLIARGAIGLIDNVNWPEEAQARPISMFVAAYSHSGIYIQYMVRGRSLRAENTADLSAVASDSCVEFFVEPHSNGHYWNFEFNCIGALNASHRTERHKPTRLSPAELASVKRYPSLGCEPIPSTDGLHTWQLMVFIPFELIELSWPLPTSIRANFNKCGSATLEPHFLSWSPIATAKPDFHRVEFFGKLIFENTNIQ